jgi:heptosyltransferase-1
MSEAAAPDNDGAILVVRLSAMGDILHALPAASSLKLSFPGRELIWVVDTAWIPLLEQNPHIDRLVSFERKRLDTWRTARRELRQSHYAFAVDFQGLIKSALVARAASPRRIFGYNREQAREGLAATFYTDPVSSPSLHAVDRGLDLAAAAGATVLTKEFPLPAGRPEGSLPEGPFVLASPLAGWASKQWPLEYFNELGQILQRESGVPLVLNAAVPLPNVTQTHASTLAGLIDATRRATAVIGVDSGPMHLAAALGKPGVAIFGPTDPARNGPYGGTLTVLRSPAAPTSYKREETIAPSMREISPRMVWNSLKEKLAW